MDRGGDVTFHGPGQLVAYPILTLPTKGVRRAGFPDTPGLRRDAGAGADRRAGRRSGCDDVGRQDGCPGVWVAAEHAPQARKIAAIGVRIERGRSLHGVALNVATDMDWFGHIVPCGITDKGVTSLAAEGVDVDLRAAVDAFVAAFERHWQPGVGRAQRRGVALRRGRPGTVQPRRRPRWPTGGANAARGVDRRQATARRCDCWVAWPRPGCREAVAITDRKPDWMRAPVRHGAGVLRLKQTVRDLGLVTVCEEAGCPNLSECWSEGTATFMVCGERCTRACGFCLVDTRHPEPLDAGRTRAGRRGGASHGPGLSRSSRWSLATTSPTAAQRTSRRRCGRSAPLGPAPRSRC